MLVRVRHTVKLQDHFDRLVVAFILLVFLSLLAIFHDQNIEVAFFEHSADLTLGCLLGLVKGTQSNTNTKEG